MTAARASRPRLAPLDSVWVGPPGCRWALVCGLVLVIRSVGIRPRVGALRPGRAPRRGHRTGHDAMRVRWMRRAEMTAP